MATLKAMRYCSLFLPKLPYSNFVGFRSTTVPPVIGTTRGLSNSVALNCESNDDTQELKSDRPKKRKKLPKPEDNRFVVVDGLTVKFRNVIPKFKKYEYKSAETSMEYMESAAYKVTYGDDPVWLLYRRNFKGQFPPKRTRRRCVSDVEIMVTGNPCPLCRDQYLVIDYRNTKLLKQFISEGDGEVLPITVTHVCQRRQKEMEVAILKAKDWGLITFDVPFRKYDYSEYFNFKK